LRKTIIGVMGPGDTASQKDRENAFALGKLIASNGWVLLSGGGCKGAMDAVNKGAKSANGLTVGILFANDHLDLSEAVDIAIVSGMGSARNNINVLSSDVVIACGLAAGTASEICLTLKAEKHVVILNDNELSKPFFTDLGKDLTHIAKDPQDAIEQVKRILASVKEPASAAK